MEPQINLSQFTFTSTDPTIVSFDAFSGKKIVLYFYPKDNTPGCTLEGRDFTTLLPEFEACNTVIIGVSRDSCECHQKFQSKQGLSFLLISDPDDQLGNAFKVIKPNSLFAKTFLGIERSTFLFDETGHCRKQWRKVTVKGHAEAVLDAAQQLSV
jgi:peroxiredoxin Q/BCP